MTVSGGKVTSPDALQPLHSALAAPVRLRSSAVQLVHAVINTPSGPMITDAGGMATRGGPGPRATRRSRPGAGGGGSHEHAVDLELTGELALEVAGQEQVRLEAEGGELVEHGAKRGLALV